MICGLQKMTLLDFPGQVACTVFLGGCNFRCPFCHNSELFTGTPRRFMEDKAFFAFLQTRQGLLDGVCVSGGEPTLYPQLPEFMARIKKLGFAVKLDTNGSRPEVLKALLDEKLVDYVAMDIKNGPERYAQTVGLESFDLTPVAESLRLLTGSSVRYELRTTLLAQLHDEQSILAMGQWLQKNSPGKKPAQLFLQSFVDRDTVLFSGLCAPDAAKIQTFRTILEPFVEKVSIRKS